MDAAETLSVWIDAQLHADAPSWPAHEWLDGLIDMLPLRRLRDGVVEVAGLVVLGADQTLAALVAELDLAHAEFPLVLVRCRLGERDPWTGGIRRAALERATKELHRLATHGESFVWAHEIPAPVDEPGSA